MPGPGDDDVVRGLGAKRRGLSPAKRIAAHNTRVKQIAGKKLNEKWAQQFVNAGYKYVFTEVPLEALEQVRPGGFPGEPPKPLEMRRATKLPEGDVIFGNSLDDLSWFDSKYEHGSSGFTPTQRLKYPPLNKNGGFLYWDKASPPVNLVDGKAVDLNGIKIQPNRGHVAHRVDLSAVASGQRDLVELLEERKGNLKPRPTPYLDLEDSRLIADRGLVAKKPPTTPPVPTAPTVPKARTLAGVEHAAEGAAKVVTRGFKARSLAIGVKAWRAARKIGKVIIECFVSVTPLDIVLDVALAIWDHEREKEERARREKQRAIEAVFKEGGTWIDETVRQAMRKPAPPTLNALIDANILNNVGVQERFLHDWNANPAFPGFLYARVGAFLIVESYRDMMGKEDDELTSYTVESREVHATNVVWEFVLEDVGDAREVEKTDADTRRLVEERGLDGLNGNMLRKMITRKRFGYTMVPALLTPYDIVITKMNNLFVDIVQFTAAFTNAGQEVFTRPFSFDYRRDWQQFDVIPDFDTPPLNRASCEYCLGYLFYSAKLLTRHALEQQDLEGNLEDPRKGWRRRFLLLQSLLDGSGTRYHKNFSYFAEQVKHLVRRGEKDAEITAALDELYAGARSIMYDLERIERNLQKPEYYYYGPQYRVKD